MPPASVEEWRACIGSSWCAVGRPFHKKIKVSSKETTVSSLHHLTSRLTLILLLMWITTRKLSCDPWTATSASGLVLVSVKDLVVMACGRLYASKQCPPPCSLFHHSVMTVRYYSVVLTELFQPTTLLPHKDWNEILNQKVSRSITVSTITFQRVDMHIMAPLIASVALLLSTVAAAVLISYLLRSGDVEINPGPGLNYDNVDASEILDENTHFDDIEEFTECLRSQYYELGMALGLSKDALERRKHEGCRDLRLLKQVLRAWLKGDKQKRTWRCLVKAIDNLDGEAAHSVAMEIASLHPSVLTEDDLCSILEHVWNFRANWKNLGIALSIDLGTLEAIEVDKRRCSDCLREMMIEWLRNDKPLPTWSALEKAMQSPILAAPEKKIYADYLKGLYADLTPTKTSSTQWPPPATKKFFRLAMIKEKEVQRGRIQDNFVRMSITGKLEDILRVKSPIELKDIFKETLDTRKLILMEGAPGSGKSTLSVHIVQQCSNGYLFPEYELVILIRLRDPVVQKAKTITDLLPGCDEEMKEKAAKRISGDYGQGVLFVFDGWDELPHDLRTNSIFYDMIKYQNRKFHKSSIIVTSRPIASGDLYAVMSTRIEVLGFTPEELKEYFVDCLQGDTIAVKTLQDTIKENPVVAGSCYLPLNASILVHLFRLKNSLSCTTQYEIFSELILTCIYRHYRERTDHKDLLLDSFDDLQRNSEVRKHFLFLCEIAYDGIMTDKITFTDLPQDISTLSLLQGVESLLMRGKKLYYNFIHLSIQELLAAYYIATQLTANEQVSRFNELFGKPRFCTVLQFYAAITKLQTSGITDIIIKVANKCASIAEPKHEDKTLLVALLNCLYEAQDSTLCTTIAKHLNTQLHLSDITLRPADCLSVGYFLSHTKNFKVKLERCSIGDDEAKVLFKAGKTYDLFSLSLFNNDIGSDGAAAISVAMKTMIHLQDLDLKGNNIGSDGATAIFSDMNTLTNLQNLYLQYNNIGDKGASAVSFAMKTMTSLKELDFQYNSIGDDGAKALSFTMKTMSNLQVLYLSDNKISSAGAKDISYALKTMTNLQGLDLSGNNIGEAGIEALKEAKENKNGYKTKIWTSGSLDFDI